MTRNAAALVGLLLGLVAQSDLHATTVYTWTDAQGVRHFSQYPPADTEQRSETLTLETPPAAPESGDRLQNIRDVARDLEDARQRREEARAKSAPPPAPPPVEPERAPVVIVPYPPYPYGAPHRPPFPHPPPHRPGPHKPKPGAQEEPEDSTGRPQPKRDAQVNP